MSDGMNGGIRAAKLSSGELVIGDFSMQNNMHLAKNLMYIGMKEGDVEGQIGIQLVPVIPFMKKDTTYELNPTAVMFWVHEYPEEIKRQYQSITSNIIVPPTKKVPNITIR